METLKDYKIVYSILHYNALDMTISCVESLLKNILQNFEIIIIDNCSTNNSGDELRNKYKNHRNIHVLLNDKNLGFARGNNIGYIYAREKCKADVIVCMNNDIIVTQENFHVKLLDYVKSNPDVAVVAPCIITGDGIYQNPFRLRREDVLKITKKIIKYSLLYIMCNSSMTYSLIQNYYNQKLMADVVKKRRIKEFNELKNIIPHGSFVIFNKKYTEKSSFAFLPITFFYCEEDILFDYLLNNNFLSAYTPTISVMHLEKKSTSTISLKEREKVKFQSKNMAESNFIFLCYRFNLKLKGTLRNLRLMFPSI